MLDCPDNANILKMIFNIDWGCMVSEEQEIFETYIRSQGLRDTFQRGQVLETFLNTEDHVSAEDLYRRINRRKRKVGFATMKLIADCGLAREVIFDDGVARFEHSYRHKHHHHLICTRCRNVIEFSSEIMEQGEKAVVEEHGFRMESHHFKIYGLCNECQNKTG